MWRTGHQQYRARAAWLPSWLLVCVVLVASVLPSGWVAGAVAAAPAVQLSAVANFGGNYQPYTWVPVTVELANAGSSVTGDVIVDVPAGQGSSRYFQRVELPTGARKALTLYAFVPDGVSALAVSFKSGKESVDAAPVALRALKQGQRLVGVIADDARASGEITRSLLSAYSSTIEAVAVAPGEVPGNPYGLGSFSGLVVSDAATGRWTGEQRQALAVWVAQGGRLVVAGGPNWRKTMEGLGDLPPVRPGDTRTLAGMPGLGALANTGRGPEGNFVVSTGGLVEGANRLAEQDGVALVAARNWGRGTVSYLAFDPSASDFAGWNGSATLWRRLALDTPLSAPLQKPFTPTSNSYGRYGHAYGASEVTDILRDLPSLSLPPTWALLIVMFLFIILAGPVNYLVLRRFDRRELAWLTIPVLTLLFAGGIYAFGAGTKGRSVVVNTVSVVRIAPGATAAEAQSFYGIFSPSRGARQLGVGQNALMTGFSSNGLGESDLGGDVRYEQGANATARDAYFSQWTFRQVAAQATVDPAPLALRVELRREGRKVTGTITNSTGRQIEDLTLVFDNAYHQLGNLAPGASVAVDWTPASQSSSISQPNYQQNLGSVLYYGPGSGYGGGSSYSGGSPYQGTTEHRRQLLDALSGSVIAYGRGSGAYAVPAPYGPPLTPTPRTNAGTQTGAQAASGPLQVIFWHPEAPLRLNLGASDQEFTTLIVQELDLGGTTAGQQRQVAVASTEEEDR